MEDLPHAARVAKSMIIFTTQPLREDERERERERDGEGERYRDDITIFFFLLL